MWVRRIGILFIKKGKRNFEVKLILSSAGKESIRNTHLVLFVSFPGYSSFLEQIKKGSDILNNVGFSFVFIRTRQAILESSIHMGFCSNLSKFYSRFLSIIYQLCYITHSAKYRATKFRAIFYSSKRAGWLKIATF